jgi:hypothetical protein
MVPFNIAIMGAPQSGKTQLARELRLATAAAAAAAATPHKPAGFVDAPPLQAALLAHQTTPNPAPLQAALSAHRAFNFTLVCGLDLATQANTWMQEAKDAALRNALSSAKLPFAVVYGQGRERLAAAQRALGALDALGTTGLAPDQNQLSRWHASCENCSDPACERALFSGLLHKQPY